MSSERIFRTTYADPTRCYCSSGSGIVDKMHLVNQSDGGKALEKIGETNLYEKIQSYREGCDIRSILEKCMMSGDYTALQKVQGTYADITGFDGDSRKVHDILNHAKFIYEGLDKKTKAHFVDFDGFLETFADTENMKKYLGLDVPADVPITTESEVVSDES